MATIQDVEFCYRVFLGRDPENDTVVMDHLQSKPSAHDIMLRIYNSVEAKQGRIREVFSTLNDQRMGQQVNIEVESTHSNQTKLMDHIRDVWSRYGQNDAYYSVLTDPKYKEENIGTDELEEFYASGEAAFARLDAALGRHVLTADQFNHVLELGCGVGRVGAVLAKKAKLYTGVDISPSHLALATQRFRQLEIDGSEFILLNNYLSEPKPYDLFYSTLVLQHNPPPVMYFLLDNFLTYLKPSGVAFFQIPFLIPGYSFSVDRYLAGDGKKEVMELHALPEQKVFDLFIKHNIQLLEVIADTDIGELGLSNTYIGKKM